MRNKKVIIIGGTTGIGREMAQQYVDKGYAVAISGRKQEYLDSFLQQNAGKPVATRCFDVLDAARDYHLQSMIEDLGGMDVFVYCSGIAHINKTLDFSAELDVMQTNTAAFTSLVCQAFNYQAAHGGGQIAGISSVAANRGLQANPAYSASKAYMSNYLEALWFRAQKRNLPITVTDVKPGFVATKMAMGNNLFWVVPVPKCARQTIAAIEAGKKEVYVSRRWRYVAFVLRHIPTWLAKRML
jgi:short-subunit dehydrogenase